MQNFLQVQRMLEIRTKKENAVWYSSRFGTWLGTFLAAKWCHSVQANIGPTPWKWWRVKGRWTLGLSGSTLLPCTAGYVISAQKWTIPLAGSQKIQSITFRYFFLFQISSKEIFTSGMKPKVIDDRSIQSVFKSRYSNKFCRRLTIILQNSCWNEQVRRSPTIWRSWPADFVLNLLNISKQLITKGDLGSALEHHD